MKREWLKAIMITGMVLLVIPLVFCISGFLLPAQYDHTFLGELKYKTQLLEETRAPRIITVGGSGVAFGVDSALLEEQFPESEVVNFGMYAALGTTVMLELSVEQLQEGDVVILIPEQQSQTLSEYFDGQMMWQAVDGAYDLLGKLSEEHRRAMIGTFPKFAAEKLTYFLQGAKPEPEGVYGRDSFNEYGDIMFALCKQNIMPGGVDQTMPVRFDQQVLEESFVETVNAYVVAAQEKGATVWYYFPPMNELAAERQELVDQYYDYLSTQLDCQILGNPHDCIMEAGWFYDTNFHLNSSGKIVYTRQLIQALKAQWLDSSPTEIDLPSMPELAEPVMIEGDDSDETCFVYEQLDGAWAIGGLTENGLKKQQLVVPTTHEGLPVQSIMAGAFSENPQLQQITIQENISLMEDGAFEGCQQLEKIYLLSLDPESCRGGQELLRGTNANIYVNQQAEAIYKTNYFWSVYAGRITSE